MADSAMDRLPLIMVDRSNGRVWAIAKLADGSGASLVIWNGKSWRHTPVLPDILDDFDIVKGERGSVAETLARSFIGDAPIDEVIGGITLPPEE